MFTSDVLDRLDVEPHFLILENKLREANRQLVQAFNQNEKLVNALYEARRCLSCGNCFECDNCYGACPEDAIVKLGPGLRYRYDYTERELEEWVPRIKEMERSAQRVHALMNNNYSNYSVKNAQQLQKLLEAWHN